LLLHYWCDSPLVKNASGGEDLSGERSDATHGGGAEYLTCQWRTLLVNSGEVF
jgi:hypothetical protein